MCDSRSVHADVVLVAELRNFMPVNWDPLSVMIELGTPNRWMMSVKNVTAFSALRFVIGRTSTHLENLSMATSRWV
jgi:hypothetical protein